MCQAEPSEWTVSEDELAYLTRLFIQFEGSSDPRSVACREAEVEFNAWIDTTYREKVALKYNSLTLSQFRSFTRNQCRLRASKQGPPFPCV